MSRPLRKLLLVSDGPEFGGAERYAIDMAKAAMNVGLQATICWLRSPGSTVDAFATARGQVPIIDVPVSGGAGLHAVAAGLTGIIRRERPDGLIINACGRPRFWTSTWVARVLGLPSVWVQHMVDSDDYRRLAPRWVGGRVEGPHLWRWPQTIRHRLASKGASAVIALNARDARMLNDRQMVPARRIAVVPDGIETARFRFDEPARRAFRKQYLAAELVEPAFVIGTAGRLVEGKGFDVLIKAIAELASAGLVLHAFIAGEGPARGELEQLARRLGVERQVHLVGFVEDMPTFYSAVDVFVLASRTESFGLTIAEAACCEHPVLATPTAGAMAQIEPGMSGLLLRGFGAEELGAALRNIHANRYIAQDMARRGRRAVVERFDISHTLEKTLQLLARGRAARGPTSVNVPARPGETGMNIVVPLPFDIARLEHGRNLRIAALLEGLASRHRLTCICRDESIAQGARRVLPEAIVEAARLKDGDWSAPFESRLLRRAVEFFGWDEPLWGGLFGSLGEADVVLGFDVPSAVYLAAVAGREGPRPRTVCDMIDDPWLTCRSDPISERLCLSGLKTTAGVAILRRALLPRLDALGAVSPMDAQSLELATGSRVHVVPNGVVLPRPSSAPRELLVVFTGAMSFGPNQAAAVHLVHSIWPAVRQRVPQVRLALVGADPGPKVTALAAMEGVTVTGRVPSVTDWLMRARVAVAPMVNGCGMKNKVLEACAAGCPVVSTLLGASGLPAGPTAGILVADEPEAFAGAVSELLLDGARAERSGAAGRTMVAAQYSWGQAVDLLAEVIAGAQDRPRRRGTIPCFEEALAHAAS